MEVVQYKARFVVHCFSQRLNIDYKETYSPLMDTITYKYLISLTLHKRLNMCLMDAVVAYVHVTLDNDIYMKILEGFKMPKACKSNS